MIRTGLFRIIFLTALFLVPLSACENTSDLQGHYWAGGPPQDKQDSPVELVLNLNGQGFWARGDERVFFKWETKNNKIWLHTKSGGIISGNSIKTDRIQIMIPGSGVIAFKKVKTFNLSERLSK